MAGACRRQRPPGWARVRSSAETAAEERDDLAESGVAIQFDANTCDWMAYCVTICKSNKIALSLQMVRETVRILMVGERVYTNSPVQEAIIDFRVEFEAPPPLELLKAIMELEKDRYPQIEPRSYYQGTFTVGPIIGASTEQLSTGYVAWNEGRTQAFQARVDGFTFSRLRPYTNWDEVRSEADRLFSRFCELTPGGRIRRSAVRFINRIDFTDPKVDLDDFFLTGLKIPPALDTGFAAALVQLHFPNPEENRMLVLNLASVPPESEGVQSFVLDLDSFESADFRSDDEAWASVERHHSGVKHAFEASITDRLREMFE